MSSRTPLRATHKYRVNSTTYHAGPTERIYADQPCTVPANIEDVDEERTDANSVLWAALSTAPAEGIPVSELITITGMSRRWVFWRLKQLAERGEAVQTVRGYWRAAS